MRVVAYDYTVPKLWTDTIETHRREVRDAVLDTAAALIAEGGLLSVTMSRVADETGIGRATLYKYFPDVESILLAWHERQVGHHLAHLVDVRDHAADAAGRLEAVLNAYADLRHKSHGHHDTNVAVLVHRGEHVAHAEHQLLHMVRSLITDAAANGSVRDDVPSDELARYCLNALATAANLRSKAAVRRLVAVTLAGVQPTGR